MDELKQQDQIFDISIKRPFVPKFFRELDRFQNEKMRRSKKKLKNLPPVTQQKLEKFQKIGLPIQHKSSKKFPQVIQNGNKIFATWKNDQINGEAEIHYSNGVVFKGVYQNGIKVKGHFKFLNGYQYVGNCLGNKFYGEGSLIFPSGKIISGEWRQYNIVGNGKIEYPQGEVYFGEIDSFKKHGKGYLFFSDGSKYIGQFQKGKISGAGTYFIDDKPVSQGVWMNGQLTKAGGDGEDIQQIKDENINFDIRQEKSHDKQKVNLHANLKNKQKTMDIDKGLAATSIADCWNIESEASNRNKKVHFNDDYD